MNTQPKQTAGNNAFLARVRRMMNTQIFRRTSAILNTEGQRAAETYLRQYFREEYKDSAIAKFRGE